MLSLANQLMAVVSYFSGSLLVLILSKKQSIYLIKHSYISGNIHALEFEWGSDLGQFVFVICP